MKNLVEKEFGLAVLNITHLNGYSNKNYHVQTENQDFVFKTYNFEENLLAFVQAENGVLNQLVSQMQNATPKLIPFLNGEHIKVLEIDGQKSICRMLSFLEGEFLGDVEHSPELIKNFGQYLAKMDKELLDIKNFALESRAFKWDIAHFQLNKTYLQDISDPKDRRLVHHFFLQFEEEVRPHFEHLRKQVIHNDPNEWNVLVEGNEIRGIIDFGDLTHTFLINELAIATAYVCYDKSDPLVWARLMVQSYHEVHPLEELEVKLLYYLIAARLCTTICNSAHSRKTNPKNAYASISEQNALNMLHKWIAISPLRAESEFRTAIGLPAVERSKLEHVIHDRKQFTGGNLSMSYRNPIHMERSALQYMYDSSGNTFLDAYNNIPHVGHSHPKVVEAGQKQMAKLNTNTRYLYDLLSRYGHQLLQHFPDELKKVFFVNSGSAASDLAIRMAQCHTQSKNIMVMELGYHGNTQTSIDISDYKFNNPKGEGQKRHIIKTPIPDGFKGKYAGDPNPGKRFGTDAVEQIKQHEGKIGAFICEPIVGCAGQIPLPDGYLQEVYPAIRAQNGICISDEVQTGFGRVGEHFWGYEAQGVIPDMVILGKPIANGHPMGAVVCTEEIAKSFEKGVEFFSSFGGNPVSCAIASAVLDVIEEEGLQENAREVGKHYMDILNQLAKDFPCIGDVRGSGLFIGIEMVKVGSLEPDTALAQHLKNEMRNRHILISTDGPYDNIIKTKPPLLFSKANAEQVV
ncbi:MAG: aminotransferase class III-fold pyridoxal phosphate-dependent enzyme, partial [Bacteroidota bacterium]